MRLLEHNNDSEFSLTQDYVSGNIPEYAILSHTWGADTEEVTYRDLIDGTGKNKVGYEKIRFCGEQARRDGLHYFWIDTCCIDKSNNNEFAEAINSMFRWYRNAAKCYVYLPDVSSPSSPISCFPLSSIIAFSVELVPRTIHEPLHPASEDITAEFAPEFAF
jgi:hypothetical protein